MNTKKTDKTESTSIGNVFREAGHKVNDFGEHAGKKSDELIHNAEDVIGKYKNDIGEYADVLSNYITQNPLKSAMIVGGIGLLLGFLLKK